jgi:hypothetical protein
MDLRSSYYEFPAGFFGRFSGLAKGEMELLEVMRGLRQGHVTELILSRTKDRV